VTGDIRRAIPEDSADITAMIHAPAEFEHSADQCTVTETQISAALFGNSPTARGHVAEVDGEVAAMALWFLNFSTWDGVAGIYLEDLFVRPRFRRRGLARALLSALADDCLDNGYTRLSWAVQNPELRRHRAVRRDRRATAARVDDLSAIGPAAG
jgi:GNAT superfamily N-acetyltransferase